jgi:CheY-like chemotaxis protein
MKDRGLVLIADDDSLLCRTIAGVLRRAGYRTIAARDGEEAILLAQRRNPNAIILDFIMPVMDGMETARALKTDQSTCDIPIVLLSAANNYELERLTHSSDTWWSARLEKPITMRTLLRTIERVTSVSDHSSTSVLQVSSDSAARAYMRQTLERLDTIQLEMEPGRSAATTSRTYELGLRHTRRLRDGAALMNSTKLERLACEAESLLENGQIEGKLGKKGLALLHSLVEKMGAAISVQPGSHATSSATASDDITRKTKVPWLLLVCDDADYSIAASSRARYYGVCVNNVAQADLACGIARRYPFAGIAIAGSLALDAAETIDALRRVCPQVPIVVAGAGQADAHRAALKAGADRILPADAEPERIIAATSELMHQGKPTLGTVLAVAEDPAVLGMIESQLIDLGCNVVSIPSMTSLSETVDAIQPDILLVDVGESSDEYVKAMTALRSQPRWSQLPIVGIAQNAVVAQSLAAHEGVADEIVIRNRLSEQIRGAVFDIMRSKGSTDAMKLDPVTGALDRNAFLASGAKILERAETMGTEVILAGVDVDTSSLEQRIGDGAADLILKALYQRVRNALAAKEPIIARLDGGYFAVLVEGAEPEELRKEVAVAASAFTPSVKIRTGAVGYSGGSSLEDLLADSMNFLGAQATGIANAPIAQRPNEQAVYIVEDDLVLRTVLTEQLSKAGFDCHGYSDGSEALDALLESENSGETPVVLLDLDLPGLDGWSVLEKLRAERPDVFHTVIMTADEDEETELRGLRSGASDYVVKPVKIPVIVERIRRLVA